MLNFSVCKFFYKLPKIIFFSKTVGKLFCFSFFLNFVFYLFFYFFFYWLPKREELNCMAKYFVYLFFNFIFINFCKKKIK